MADYIHLSPSFNSATIVGREPGLLTKGFYSAHIIIPHRKPYKACRIDIYGTGGEYAW